MNGAQNSRGGKRTALVLLAIAALLAVTLFGLLQLLNSLLARYNDPAAVQSAPVGVAATGAVSEIDPENLHTVVFPAWQEGRDETNAAVYDTPPFTVTLALPAGWMTVLPPAEERTPGAPWTCIQLVDAAGAVCGELGFDPAGTAVADAVQLQYPAADVYIPALQLTVQLRMDPACITEAGLAALANSLSAAPAA